MNDSFLCRLVKEKSLDLEPTRRTFTDEDVALDVDDVILGETVHGDLGFGVTFVVVNERRGDFLLGTSRKIGKMGERSDVLLVQRVIHHHRGARFVFLLGKQ